MTTMKNTDDLITKPNTCKLQVMVEKLLKRINQIYRATRKEILLLANKRAKINLAKFAAICIFLIAALLAIDLVFLLVSVFQSDDAFIGNLGTFGDFLGGTLNPIFTFLTFIGLLVTIFIQRKELSLTRIELSKTAKAASIQTAESSIFNLINLHRKIFSEITNEIPERKGATNQKKQYKSVDAFNRLLASQESDSKPIKKDDLVYYKYATNKEKNHVFGPYFRVLYQILNTIDKYDSSMLDQAQKIKYIDIVRSQLSNSELILLFFNSLYFVSDNGELKELLIKYEFLKEISLTEYKYNKIEIHRTLENGKSIDFKIKYYSISSFNIHIPEYFIFEYIDSFPAELTQAEDLELDSAFGKIKISKESIENARSLHFDFRTEVENSSTNKELFFSPPSSWKMIN